MRTETDETITTTTIRHNTHIKCDGCGGDISAEPDVHPNQYANELTIFLDPDECVSFHRRRDYCTVCLEPIWEAINKLIKADPDQEGCDPPSEEWGIYR